MSLSHITIPALCLIPKYGYETASLPRSPVPSGHSPFSAFTQTSGCSESKPLLAFFPSYKSSFSLVSSSKPARRRAKGCIHVSTKIRIFSSPEEICKTLFCLKRINRCVIWVSPLTVSGILSLHREQSGSAFPPILFAVWSWKLHVSWFARSRMWGAYLRSPLNLAPKAAHSHEYSHQAPFIQVLPKWFLNEV